MIRGKRAKEVNDRHVVDPQPQQRLEILKTASPILKVTPLSHSTTKQTRPSPHHEHHSLSPPQSIFSLSRSYAQYPNNLLPPLYSIKTHIPYTPHRPPASRHAYITSKTNLLRARLSNIQESAYQKKKPPKTPSHIPSRKLFSSSSTTNSTKKSGEKKKGNSQHRKPHKSSTPPKYQHRTLGKRSGR